LKEIELKKAILIDSAERQILEYDAEEITVELYSHAMEKRKKSVTADSLISGAFVETDPVSNLYLG
jgi:hypothetical protein